MVGKADDRRFGYPSDGRAVIDASAIANVGEDAKSAYGLEKDITMGNAPSPISNWLEAERAAWVLSAPKWQRMAHVLLGMAVGLIAGLAISHFSG